MVWPIHGTEAHFYRYIIIAPIVFLACWLFNKYRLKKWSSYKDPDDTIESDENE